MISYHSCADLETILNEAAINAAKEIFGKRIIPVQSNEIAANGGCINFITWGM